MHRFPGNGLEALHCNLNAAQTGLEFRQIAPNADIGLSGAKTFNLCLGRIQALNNFSVVEFQLARSVGGART